MLTAIGLFLKGIFKAVPIRVWIFGAAIGLTVWAGKHWLDKTIGHEVYLQVFAVEIRERAEDLKDKADASRLAADSAKVSQQVVIEYRDRIQYIESTAPAIIEKVPVYVTAQNDSACTVNHGFVSLWNATNSGTVPGAAGRSDAAASDVVLSDIARQHAAEATLCQRTEGTLMSLQDWVMAQRAVYGGH